MKQLLNKALVIAATAHDGQYDKGGNPYLLHALKVFHYLKSDDEELNCIAVLHDVIEDTNKTFYSLREDGMTERIIKGIIALTKMPGQSEEEYLEAILNNRDAILVKMCDLRHNMDIRRLKGVTEKDMKRLDKYAKMYQTLKESFSG